jgi:hypothetical protein
MPIAVKAMWAQANTAEIIQSPLREMIHTLVTAVAELFEQPVSRVVFVQFYIAREIFQSIDESMTQEAIDFMASLLQQRNPSLGEAQCSLLAEVCVHSSNAVILSALRNPHREHRQQLVQQIEDLLVSYLEPYVGEGRSSNVMKVMKCLHCQSEQLSKNGYRRGSNAISVRNAGKQFVENFQRF